MDEIEAKKQINISINRCLELINEVRYAGPYLDDITATHQASIYLIRLILQNAEQKYIDKARTTLEKMIEHSFNNELKQIKLMVLEASKNLNSKKQKFEYQGNTANKKDIKYIDIDEL